MNIRREQHSDEGPARADILRLACAWGGHKEHRRAGREENRRTGSQDLGGHLKDVTFMLSKMGNWRIF